MLSGKLLFPLVDRGSSAALVMHGIDCASEAAQYRQPLSTRSEQDMMAFLREHLVLALVLAYTLGQVTAVVVLGGLTPRDPGREQEADSHTRAPVRAPFRRPMVRRFSSGTPSRATARVSGSNRLRRFLDREGAIEMN